MIKFNNTAVMNFENAMRGARNPLNSWARSDSSYDETETLFLVQMTSILQKGYVRLEMTTENL